MSDIAGIVLAGGLSTRMGGQDKCLLELDGQTLLQRAALRLAPQVGAIAINANSRHAGYMQPGLPVVRDSFTGFAGPLAGVLSGMEWAQSVGANHVVTVAADTPFFPNNLVQVMQNALANNAGKIVIAQTPNAKGRFFNHPTFGLWPVNLQDDLRRALQGGMRKVIQWADPHVVINAAFSTDPYDPFFNVNSPEDFLEAQLYIKEHSL